MPPIDANLIAGIEVFVAIAQLFALILVGFVALRYLRETRRARLLDPVLHLYDGFSTPQAYADADAALGLPAHIEDYTPEELELATSTAREFERLAFLVESGAIPASYIIPLYSRHIVWTWDALQPFILEQRRLRDSGGAYRPNSDGRYFESLASRALAYRQKTFPDSKRAHPAVPAAYGERLRATIARGERIGSGGYR